MESNELGLKSAIGGIMKSLKQLPFLLCSAFSVLTVTASGGFLAELPAVSLAATSVAGLFAGGES